MSRTKKDPTEFLAAVTRVLGAGTVTVTRAMIQKVVDQEGLAWPHWLTSDVRHRGQRGQYNLKANMSLSPLPKTASGTRAYKSNPKVPVFRPQIPQTVSAPPLQQTVPAIANTAVPVLVDSSQLGSTETFEHQSLVPLIKKAYVPFGHYNTLRSIVSSGRFYTSFVTGLSGNGKTEMVEQICANLDREVIRVNITAETDEDDLLGGFRLQDGKTVWQNGPVVVAMERGALLLLDEVDLGSNKLMCLQPVLEGKPVYLKKINKVVKPNKGFNVIATANTKGQGSMDGKFVGTQVLNEAFLERFSITIEQEYPSNKVEEKILIGALGVAMDESALVMDDFHAGKAIEFISYLVAWASGVRKSYFDGAISEIISTRRLIHIINAFVIFDYNRRMAVELCLSRFDIDTKTQFMDLYTKIDPEVDGLVKPQAAPEGVSVPEVTAESDLASLPGQATDVLNRMAQAVAKNKAAQQASTAATAQAAAKKAVDWNQTLKDVSDNANSETLKDITQRLSDLITAKKSA